MACSVKMMHIPMLVSERLLNIAAAETGVTKAALHFCPVIFTLFFFGQSLSAYCMPVKWYCCTMSTHITCM